MERGSLITLVYLLAGSLWLGLIYWLDLWRPDLLTNLVLLLPVLVLGLSFYCLEGLEPEAEEQLYRLNYLSAGLVVVVPLLVWLANEYGGNKRRFLGIVLTAVALIVMAMFDVWVPGPYISTLRQAQSCLEVLALALVIYSLHSFYLESGHDWTSPPAPASERVALAFATAQSSAYLGFKD